MKSNERERIWVVQTSEVEIYEGGEDQIIQAFCRIGSSQEIRTPLFNLRKFQKPEKSTAE